MKIELVKANIDKIGIGLKKYNTIMDELYTVDVSKNLNFQRMYNHFYRMGRRSEVYYTLYFALMESLKGKDVSYSYILQEIYSSTGRIEASFASKLLATINPSMPVWDKFVLQNFNLKAPYYYSSDRLVKIANVYKEIETRFQENIETQQWIEELEKFDDFFPGNNLTQVKKADLIIWQMR